MNISNPNLKTWPQEEMKNRRPSYEEKIAISFISTWKKIDNSHCYDEPKTCVKYFKITYFDNVNVYIYGMY
jgi:hypothetical protein